MMKRVVITGMGTICPIGNNTNEMWENILNNKTPKLHKSAF